MNESALEAWGNEIGKTVDTPVVIALRGDLGAGKSVLARAIARGAGVQGPMPSPTFNLVYRYTGKRATVVHLDLYRIELEDDVWELGWRELGTGNEIVLAEWPERAETLLPPDRWEIRIAPGAADDLRVVSATPFGNVGALPSPAPFSSGRAGASS
jgi:tRNA threonylcarbamoyladenosine biosynthesis protein TsaE